jgi:NAD(P)-dependent dehydrogenase (short-subunit alcohol dehydrogenase family)
LTEKPLALVTGVGPGTGSAVVRRFAAGGFRVVAVARSPDRIDALCHIDNQDRSAWSFLSELRPFGEKW